MNWDRVEGNWKQLTGKVKEQWGKLTEDDITVINGKQDQLVGRIQERYGIAKDEAREARSIAGSTACSHPQVAVHRGTRAASCVVTAIFTEVSHGTRSSAVAPGSADPGTPADVGPGLAALMRRPATKRKGEGP